MYKNAFDGLLILPSKKRDSTFSFRQKQMTAELFQELWSEFQWNNLVYYVRNHARNASKKGHSTDSFGKSRLLRNHFKNSDWNFKSKDFLYYNRNNVKNRKKSNLTLLVRKSRWLQNSFKNSCRNSNFVYYIRNHSKNAKPAAFFDTKNGMLNFFIRQKQTTAELHISRILIRIWREQVCLLH